MGVHRFLHLQPISTRAMLKVKQLKNPQSWVQRIDFTDTPIIKQKENYLLSRDIPPSSARLGNQIFLLPVFLLGKCWYHRKGVRIERELLESQGDIVLSLRGQRRERFCFAIYRSGSRIVHGACCPVSYGNMQKNSALSVDVQAFLRGLEEHLLSWASRGQAEVGVKKQIKNGF